MMYYKGGKLGLGLWGLDIRIFGDMLIKDGGGRG